ncbi:MAG: TIGR02710 family CRISPR-associated CARF protein [Thiotrichales bacterium]
MKTLICSVGGSHQPVIKAIDENQPEFILFVCSEDDPDTGKAGSYEQIEKKGLFLKKHFADEKPSLPNIPSQLGLDSNSYDIVRVYADDLDNAYQLISQKLETYVERDDEITVDYTGGTKSMSAALCLAGLDQDSVNLQLVTGSRADLSKVQDGTEQSQQARIGRTRFQLKLRKSLSSWAQFAYDDTVFQLKKEKPQHPEDRGALSTARNLSKAFSAWDRFAHDEALDILQNYTAKYGKELAPYLAQLRLLSTDGPKSDASRLLDLWLNAQRRAQQKRYDDATSRTYRLLEWTAQWILKNQADIDTSAVPSEKIPPQLQIPTQGSDTLKLALFDAWSLAAHYGDDATKAFWSENQELIKDLLHIRNTSILAHGFTPITEGQWNRIQNFIDSSLLPLLLKQLQALGLKNLPAQLPQTYWK